jgi:hypothetical protein
MLRLIFEIQHKIWDHRNAKVHYDPEKEQAASDQVSAAVRDQYTLGQEDLLPGHLYLIHEASDVILKRSRSSQELWLRQIRAARHKDAALSRTHMAQERATLLNWLRTAGGTTP